MAAQIGPFADFSWSHSRDRVFRACKREYFWQHYASHGGWLAAAANQAQLAYALKQLTTFEMEFGASIHRAAARIAHAIRDGSTWPEREELEAQVKADLNALYSRSQDLRTFALRPKYHPVDRHMYYGGTLEPERQGKLQEKLQACVGHLLSAPVWTEVVAAGPDAILVIDELAKFNWDTLDIWVAPDLVFRGDDGVNLVDWKTGRLLPDPEQLGLYGLYAREVLDLDPPYLGRLVGLEEGNEVIHEITDEALEAVEDRIFTSVLHMRTYTVDPDTNQPLSFDRFPLTDHRERCNRCSYYALCRRELES
jgi:hypothetical protein